MGGRGGNRNTEGSRRLRGADRWSINQVETSYYRSIHGQWPRGRGNWSFDIRSDAGDRTIRITGRHTYTEARRRLLRQVNGGQFGVVYDIIVNA